MALTTDQQNHIKKVIKDCIRKKFEKYNPETSHMPFHYRLLGKDRMALYSFIHSLNTSFGISIFEPVAVEIAKLKFKKAIAQHKLQSEISSSAQSTIQDIMNKLSTGKDPNKTEELKKIRKASQDGTLNKFKTIKVDLYLESYNNELFLIDLKTAKPNIGNFKSFKRTLLEWAAIVMSSDNSVNINTLIAIPYNPYAPEPYQRWTLKGMLDLKEELKVANEFWNFLGGDGVYEDLLSSFEQAGIELRPEIDRYFSNFKDSQY